jgi:hypothetical protein
VICWLPAHVQATRHALIGVAPLFCTVIVATNPTPQSLSAWYVAVTPAPPVGVGDGEGDADRDGGLEYANDLTQWLRYKPTEPTGNLAAFAHLYNFNASHLGFDSQLAPVAAQVPLTLSEIGENDLRPRLHRRGDELGRRARGRVPGLDLEQLGLLQRPRVHLGLHGYPNRLRAGFQGSPGDGQQLRRPAPGRFTQTAAAATPVAAATMMPLRRRVAFAGSGAGRVTVADSPHGR